ncbi:MAG: protein kinase [Deltaproteobacteria bacterium]|nr:protein kinase [Deltaproteobacteria bacterium]
MSSDGAKASASGRNIGDVVVGRYRITGVVGKGAMGAVYAAEHTATGQKVALKFMIVGDDEDKEFIARFEQEAKVMAGLRSTNTIRIYDFGRADDGALFMAMELLVGKPLDKHVRDLAREGKAMTEQEAGRLTVQILRSLTEAHGLGLVHRDMKPGNVFLNDDGGDDVIAKVLDFGLARVGNSALTNVGRIMGTPAYMAPEQWQGAAVTPPADLYAVGCMMHAMVTGDPPYQAGDNVLSLMHKHCTEDIPDPRLTARVRLSEGYVAVMTKAMAKKAADRYQDAKAMRQAIEAVLGGSWTSHTNLGTAPKGDVTSPYLADSQPKLTESQRGVVRSPSGAATSDAETLAGAAVDALRARAGQANAGHDSSADATIAAPPPGHKSNVALGHNSDVAVGQHSATYMAGSATAEAIAAPKAKAGLIAGATAAVVALAAVGWWATRPSPPAPSPAPPAAAPAPSASAPAAAPPAAEGPAQPAVAPQPAVAQPQPAPATPVIHQAADAASGPGPAPTAPAPDAGATVAAPAEPAKPTAPSKPKAPKPSAPKKKAQGYETVD